MQITALECCKFTHTFILIRHFAVKWALPDVQEVYYPTRSVPVLLKTNQTVLYEQWIWSIHDILFHTARCQQKVAVLSGRLIFRVYHAFLVFNMSVVYKCHMRLSRLPISSLRLHLVLGTSFPCRVSNPMMPYSRIANLVTMLILLCAPIWRTVPWTGV